MTNFVAARAPMRSLLAGLVLATLAACGGDSATAPTTASVAGTWTLQTYNGNALPYTVVSIGSDMAELLAGSIVLESGGKYTIALQIRYTESGVVTTESQTDQGTYEVRGTALVLQSSADPSAGGTGALSGDTLTFSGSGEVLVFRKT